MISVADAFRVLPGLRLSASLTLCAFLSVFALPQRTEAIAPDIITKAELLMALIESRVADVPVIDNPGTFPDVPKGHKYGTYMIIAEKYGVIAADPKTKNLFPDRAVTRAEFLRMASFTFGLPSNLTYLYKDIFAGDWYAAYAGVAEKYDLFRDDQDTRKLRPGKLLTRTEAVQAIRQILRKTREEERKATKPGADASSTHDKIIVTLGDEIKKSTVGTLTVTAQTPKLREEVLRIVNVERKKAGLGPLVASPELDRSAQAYAQDMATLGFFSHVSPKGDTLKERILATGYVDITELSDCNCLLGYAFGENLAKGQKTPKDVMKAWMKSEGHKENIVQPLYTQLGVGIYGGVWVQHFGGILTPDE